MLRRDARSGELRLLFAALAVGVAALTVVGFFTDRVAQALALEANQLLGADLLLTADHPWPDRIKVVAREHGLRLAETQGFPSMASAGESVQLAEIKAVTPEYPLRGHLRVAASPPMPPQTVDSVPAAGAVWPDERLAAALNVRVGDTLKLGQRSFTVSAILTFEPDRGFNFFSLAPRLMMNLQDLAATGLVQPGSRVVYRILLAGDAGALAAFRQGLEPSLARGERVEDAQNARPELRTALERAQRFLGLSALLTVLISAVAVALAARRYVERHLDTCAVMRALGAKQGDLLQIFSFQFAGLAAAGAALGCLIGWAAHYVLGILIGELVSTQLPPPSLTPLWQGVATALLLIAFAMPMLWRLHRVPTLRVMRREITADGRWQWLLWLPTLLLLAAVMVWVAGNWLLGAYTVGGLLITVLVFALLTRLALRGLARWRGDMGFEIRYALAGLERHATTSIVQVVALALGILAILLLTVTRGQLLDAWHRNTPPDAPNRFVINVQPDQAGAVQQALNEAGLQAKLWPMIRGRLVRINGHEIKGEDYADERIRRLVEREFNLSWRADLPSDNKLSAGQWFGRGAGDEASVEEGLAKTLNLGLGDRLEFDVAGQPVVARVTSLRKLNWDSMQVNFFVLMPPGMLDNYPQSLITSFYLPPAREDVVRSLLQRFPNLTVIDVGAVIAQLQWVMDQLAKAVQFVFLFTLVAGFAVLHAALANVLDERRLELALMRALGAQEQALRRSLFVGFATLGGLAGLLAALGSLAVGWALSRFVFHLDFAFAWWLPIVVAMVGALLTPLIAWSAMRKLLRSHPLEALRSA